jgi:hypothetical protein
LILSLSQFSLLPQLPQKMKLDVVKIDSKKINLPEQSKSMKQTVHLLILRNRDLEIWSQSYQNYFFIKWKNFPFFAFKLDPFIVFELFSFVAK